MTMIRKVQRRRTTRRLSSSGKCEKQTEGCSQNVLLRKTPVGWGHKAFDYRRLSVRLSRARP